jgi:hypothetical protein
MYLYRLHIKWDYKRKKCQYNLHVRWQWIHTCKVKLLSEFKMFVVGLPILLFLGPDGITYELLLWICHRYLLFPHFGANLHFLWSSCWLGNYGWFRLWSFHWNRGRYAGSSYHIADLHWLLGDPKYSYMSNIHIIMCQSLRFRNCGL